ncbi:MAG: hypothetical protein FIB01_10555 [Gemmatimonadetes bacterium]|nr:hypothetical protein [Gemmatimonadota bacterium]
MRRFIGAGTVVTLMLLLSAGNAVAQQTTPAVAQVHAQALALQENQSMLVPAARLYLREAALRGDDDPQGVKCLTTAAHLFYYAGRRAEGRRVMEQAANAALAVGDINAAARTYLLAAWMAQADGRTGDTRRLAHEAEMLAASPLLAAVDRTAIRQWVNGVTTISLR